MDWSAVISAVLTVIVGGLLTQVDRRNERRHQDNKERFDAIRKNQDSQAVTLAQLSDRVSYMEGRLSTRPRNSAPRRGRASTA